MADRDIVQQIQNKLLKRNEEYRELSETLAKINMAIEGGMEVTSTMQQTINTLQQRHRQLEIQGLESKRYSAEQARTLLNVHGQIERLGTERDRIAHKISELTNEQDALKNAQAKGTTFLGGPISSTAINQRVSATTGGITDCCQELLNAVYEIISILSKKTRTAPTLGTAGSVPGAAPGAQTRTVAQELAVINQKIALEEQQLNLYNAAVDSLHRFNDSIKRSSLTMKVLSIILVAFGAAMVRAINTIRQAGADYTETFDVFRRSVRDMRREWFSGRFLVGIGTAAEINAAFLRQGFTDIPGFGEGAADALRDLSNKGLLPEARQLGVDLALQFERVSGYTEESNRFLRLAFEIGEQAGVSHLKLYQTMAQNADLLANAANRVPGAFARAAANAARMGVELRSFETFADRMTDFETFLESQAQLQVALPGIDLTGALLASQYGGQQDIMDALAAAFAGTDIGRMPRSLRNMIASATGLSVDDVAKIGRVAEAEKTGKLEIVGQDLVQQALNKVDTNILKGNSLLKNIEESLRSLPGAIISGLSGSLGTIGNIIAAGFAVRIATGKWLPDVIRGMLGLGAGRGIFGGGFNPYAGRGILGGARITHGSGIGGLAGGGLRGLAGTALKYTPHAALLAGNYMVWKRNYELSKEYDLNPLNYISRWRDRRQAGSIDANNRNSRMRNQTMFAQLNEALQSGDMANVSSVIGRHDFSQNALRNVFQKYGYSYDAYASGKLMQMDGTEVRSTSTRIMGEEITRSNDTVSTKLDEIISILQRAKIEINLDGRKMTDVLIAANARNTP